MSFQWVSDSWVLTAARDGDRAAFAAIYDRHGADIRRYAFRLTGSESIADDIVHDALLRAVECQTKVAEDFQLLPYLRVTARNCIFRRSERENRFVSIEGYDEPDDSDLTALVEAGEIRVAVTKAMMELPENQRDAIVSADLEELPLAEAAEVAGCSVNVFKARLHRARENMRRKLGPLFKKGR